MPSTVAVACGSCCDVIACDHAIDFCPHCKARFDRSPVAIISIDVTTNGGIGIGLRADFAGAWDAGRRAAIEETIGQAEADSGGLARRGKVRP